MRAYLHDQLFSFDNQLNSFKEYKPMEELPLQKIDQMFTIIINSTNERKKSREAILDMFVKEIGEPLKIRLTTGSCITQYDEAVRHFKRMREEHNRTSFEGIEGFKKAMKSINSSMQENHVGKHSKGDAIAYLINSQVSFRRAKTSLEMQSTLIINLLKLISEQERVVLDSLFRYFELFEQFVANKVCLLDKNIFAQINKLFEDARKYLPEIESESKLEAIIDSDSFSLFTSPIAGEFNANVTKIILY